jgi:RND family efflux transporter, MFP subunit
MIKKIFISVISVAIVGSATYFVGSYIMQRKAEDAKDTTPSFVVKRVTISDKVIATGFVEPIVSTEIRSEINGKIAFIHVQNGDVVKAGALLMELDKTSLQSAETKANNEYALQKLTLEQEERDFARQEELMKKGFAIMKDFDDARTRLEKAKIQLKVKESEWEKAKDDLSKTSIISPQGGTVTDMELNPGQVIVGAGSVNQGTLLMKVSSLESLYVEVKINEKEIEKIRPDKTPKITFDSMGELAFDGEIIAMSPYARTENSVRVFPVKVAFKAAGGRVRPGISANIEFPVSTVENVLAVRLSAVYSDSEVRYVFVKTENGMWEKARVETGISNLRFVEITRGLNEGDVVAMAFPQKNLLSDEIRGFAGDAPKAAK